MISRQRRQPDEVLVIDEAPRDASIDLAWRVRLGLTRAKELKLDLVSIWEDDDYYSENYLQWVESHAGSAKILGPSTTWYYNLRTRQIWRKDHAHHISLHAMSLTPEPILSTFPWPKRGEEPRSLDARIVSFACAKEEAPPVRFVATDGTPLVISMKCHEEGAFIGDGHKVHWTFWQKEDADLSFLSTHVLNPDDLAFYKSLMR
jgi:hypothetical protein